MLLSSKDLLKVRSLIVAYEFVIGLIYGHLLNAAITRVLPYASSANSLFGLAVLLLVAIPTLTSLLYIREKVEQLPGLKEYDLKNKSNFAHPPPLGLGFGFWGAMGQLKDRNAGANMYFSSVVGF